MSLFSSLKDYIFGATTSSGASDAPEDSSTTPTEASKSRFRLDNGISDRCILQVGPKLGEQIIGYAQYGLPTERAIFFLHGLPGSRFDAASLDDIGLKLGARIICPDRPGYGSSSAQPEYRCGRTLEPGRMLLDYPKDIELLAKHLGIDQFSVLVSTLRRSSSRRR